MLQPNASVYFDPSKRKRTSIWGADPVVPETHNAGQNNSTYQQAITNKSTEKLNKVPVDPIQLERLSSDPREAFAAFNEILSQQRPNYNQPQADRLAKVAKLGAMTDLIRTLMEGTAMTIGQNSKSGVTPNVIPRNDNMVGNAYNDYQKLNDKYANEQAIYNQQRLAQSLREAQMGVDNTKYNNQLANEEEKWNKNAKYESEKEWTRLTNANEQSDLDRKSRENMNKYDVNARAALAKEKEKPFFGITVDEKTKDGKKIPQDYPLTQPQFYRLLVDLKETNNDKQAATFLELMDSGKANEGTLTAMKAYVADKIRTSPQLINWVKNANGVLDPEYERELARQEAARKQGEAFQRLTDRYEQGTGSPSEVFQFFGGNDKPQYTEQKNNSSQNVWDF